MKLKSGEVVVDRYNSHLHSSVLVILPEALARIETKGRTFIVEEVEFDRIIGESNCVSTNRNDSNVSFARRPKRFGLTRFVKNRQPEPKSSAVCILKTAEDEPGKFVLVAAFIGQKSPPEPWDEFAEPDSIPFWKTHALIWGSEPVIPGTETTICPW